VNFFDILVELSQGTIYTVLVTLVCCATGMLLGLLIAGLRRTGVRWLVTCLDAFTYIFRSLPVLVLLFLVYFGLPSIGIRLHPLVAMALSLGVIAAAYLAEVFRGAFDSISPLELTAAQAIGLTKLQTLWSIEFPQMIRFAVPGMLNEFTSVLKFSPFAYTVGIPEITKNAGALAASTLHGVQVYLAAGILYFLIYRILRSFVEFFERRWRIPGLVTA
jgi:polar amino acid transport system permease protein